MDPSFGIMSNKDLWLPSVLHGSSILIALVCVILIALYRGQGDVDARTLVFTTLVVSNLALAFVSRGGQRSLPKSVFWIDLIPPKLQTHKGRRFSEGRGS